MARVKHIRELMRAVLAPVPRLSLVEARDKGIRRSQLISVRDALKMAESRFSQFFKALERACNEAANECEGKSEREIRQILRAKFNAKIFQTSRKTKPKNQTHQAETNK